MSASTTKYLVLLLFTGTLVSARGMFSKRKNKEKEMKELQEKEMKELQEKKNNAAVKIQRLARGNQARNQVEKLKRNNAAVKIQHLARGKQARNQVEKLKTTALLKDQLKETYKTSTAKATVNAMAMKEDADRRHRDINMIKMEEISHKVKNKKNGSYKMSTRPATKIPTKENIAQSQKKELKKRNENNNKDLKGFFKNQEDHKEAEQHVAGTANKWRDFNKGRQEKQKNDAAEVEKKKVTALKNIQQIYRKSKAQRDADDADLKTFEMDRFKSFEEVSAKEEEEEFFDADDDDSVQEVDQKSNYSTPKKKNAYIPLTKLRRRKTPEKKNRSNPKKHVFNPEKKNASQKNFFKPKKTQRKLNF